LVPDNILPSQSVASHKSVAPTKSVAKKYEVKLWLSKVWLETKQALNPQEAHGRKEIAGWIGRVSCQSQGR
jgi:hypothetical protein